MVDTCEHCKRLFATVNLFWGVTLCDPCYFNEGVIQSIMKARQNIQKENEKMAKNSNDVLLETFRLTNPPPPPSTSTQLITTTNSYFSLSPPTSSSSSKEAKDDEEDEEDEELKFIENIGKIETISEVVEMEYYNQQNSTSSDRRRRRG